LLYPRTRWLLCWLLALGCGIFAAEEAWIGFNDAGRTDGNWGHASIDFGGQWVMGHMIVEGHGRQLYNRNYLRPVVEQNYPDGVESEKSDHTDAVNLLGWLSGEDAPEAPKVAASLLLPLAANDVYGEAMLLAAGHDLWTEDWLAPVVAPHRGGALYPPVHALWFAPLAALPPPLAYRVLQAIILALVFVDGWIIERMTEGRVWWPVAVVYLLVFPGFSGSLNLGQNAMLSLTVLLAGWWQLMRGRPVLAGVCWGLLAFKPVWAASFFLVPILTRRWRMAVSMALMGLAQIALTLPLVGGESWLNWFHVGRAASREYTIQENWIFLSRDLLGIPRRWLLTFDNLIARKPEEQLLPTILGWSLWSAVLAGTLFVVARRWRRMQALTGPAAAFVLTGAFFTCYHFMYYDFLLAALPVLLLFTQPRRCLSAAFGPYLHPLTKWIGNGFVEPNEASPAAVSRQGRIEELMPVVLLTLILILPPIGCLCDPTNHFPPGETFALLILWAWCGYRVLRDVEARSSFSPQFGDGFSPAPAAWQHQDSSAVQFAQLGADIGGADERLADQHGADTGRL
jgi:hypothetical protein